MDTQTFIARWEAAVAARDFDRVGELFTEDAIFRSPAVFKPYQGRDTIRGILSLVIQVFGDLTYTNVWSNNHGGVVMQFSTTVPASPDKRLDIEGVDIFQLDAAGQITEMRVMIRPLRGLQAVAAAMEKMMGL
ncbi:MAG: nuclear transport factor 2 family protein [Anaerolineae bacterium]